MRRGTGADVAVLVADDGRADFGSYVRELLSLEGISPVQLALEGLDFGVLPRRVVTAADLPLTIEEAEALRAHVERGARLLLLAPAPHAGRVFGFAPTWESVLGGYLRLQVPSFPNVPLQVHGALRRLVPPGGAEVLGTLFGDRDGSLGGDPAIVRTRVGDGELIVFLYDLARSVALTRGGDPRRVLHHGNGVEPGWRASDMFAGFLDPECARVPQADLQCHLLRMLLVAPLHEPVGVPFLWYFPAGAPTALLLSSDDDYSTPEQFDELRACLRRYGARTTHYLMADTFLAAEHKAELEAEGDSFSLHPMHREPLARTWKQTLEETRAAFVSRFGCEPGPSIRNDSVAWQGYVDSARWNAECGFSWDGNFLSVGERAPHYMTGGGLPLRFVDSSGDVLSLWQLPAHYGDDTVLGDAYYSLRLSTPTAIDVIGGMLKANADSHHSMLCLIIHPVSFAQYSSDLWSGVLAEAARLDIPRLSLDEFAAFWERRREVEITASEASDSGYEWRVRVPSGCDDLSLLLPASRSVRVSWNGESADVESRTIDGVEHATVWLPPTAGEWVLSVDLVAS
jgi:hypothetical protein